VDRAIEIVEQALTMHGAPIYVRHEVVHNRFVVENLEQKGAVFVENLDEVPSGSILIFSAHGVSHEVRREAEVRKFKVFDATCPLVTKVHVEVAKMRAQGKEIIMIGHHMETQACCPLMARWHEFPFPGLHDANFIAHFFTSWQLMFAS
jgi:4-hydroxy-3-methylbut-2-enyl diphosphate reductase